MLDGLNRARSWPNAALMRQCLRAVAAAGAAAAASRVAGATCDLKMHNFSAL